MNSEATTADPASPGAVRTGDEALAEARSDAHADRDGPVPGSTRKARASEEVGSVRSGWPLGGLRLLKCM